MFKYYAMYLVVIPHYSTTFILEIYGLLCSETDYDKKEKASNQEGNLPYLFYLHSIPYLYLFTTGCKENI